MKLWRSAISSSAALESVILITVAEINKLSLIGVSEAYLNGGVERGLLWSHRRINAGQHILG